MVIFIAKMWLKGVFSHLVKMTLAWYLFPVHVDLYLRVCSFTKGVDSNSVCNSMYFCLSTLYIIKRANRNYF